VEKGRKLKIGYTFSAFYPLPNPPPARERGLKNKKAVKT